MRDRKFRGLTAKIGWVYGDLVYDLPGTTSYYSEYSQRIKWFPETGGEANSHVKNGTVGEFTGMYDKNGKEIYEGDILDLHQTLNGCRLFCVEWPTEQGLVLRYAENRINSQKYEYDATEVFSLCKNNGDVDYEIIGNIHENPELLK